MLNQQIEELHNKQSALEQEYIQIQGREKQLVDALNQKYGPGQLDPQTGVFTPAPTQEAPELPNLQKTDE